VKYWTISSQINNQTQVMILKPGGLVGRAVEKNGESVLRNLLIFVQFENFVANIFSLLREF